MMYKRSVYLGSAISAIIIVAMIFDAGRSGQYHKNIVNRTAEIKSLAVGKKADSKPELRTQLDGAEDLQFGASASSQRDLWKYANAMRHSTDPAKIMEARHSISLCNSLNALSPEMSVFVSGGHSQISGPLTPQRQLAFSEITSRCSGFRAASKSDVQALRNDLNQQAKNYARVEFEAATASQFSAQQKVALIYSGSASQIAQGLPQVAKDWALSQNLFDPKDPQRDDMLTAAFLAACDLGTDCTPNGFETQLQCVMNGECDRFWQGIEDGLDDSRKLRVSQYRAQLLAAIQGRNIASLGLNYANIGPQN